MTVGERLDRDHLRQERLRARRSVQDVVFCTLFVVEHELHRNPRVAGPPRVRWRAPIAHHVAGCRGWRLVMSLVMSHRGHDSRRPALPHRITFRRLHSDPGKYCFRATPRQHRPLSFGSHQPSRLVGYRRRLCERRTHGGCRRPDRRTQCRRRQRDQARVRPRIDQR
ncbi:Uncharacterised protein [Mycobacteroides abscessus subsp. abscessus]|nr:Uncharacterised protein [Mycobacteroides abscessus subsp. abscessus]